MDGSASQAGFYYQNNVAALKIIECLFFDNDITHIELENYEQGKHIDDIIIYRQKSIEYYQVKWSSNDDSPYTLYNLTHAQAPKKSIFRQLAEGYTSVQNQGKDFTILLFTTKNKSDRKKPGDGIEHGISEIINKFIAPLLKFSKHYDALPEYKTYQKTIDLIEKATGLDKDQFDDFLRKLRFRFSQPDIADVQAAIRHRLSNIGIEESLLDKLLNVTVNWSINGESITKDNLLRQLGIKDRFEDKLSHYFKTVDDKVYVPNTSLFTQLEKALDTLKGGYIFIEGLPGIGKSTAVTKFKQAHSDAVFAYYCFVPGTEGDFGKLRHKSNYFLKSMCIAIEKHFTEVDLPAKYSDRYEEKLAGYIDKLGTLGRRVVFVIDGLDHVHRDLEFENRSLLNQIKGALPNGVFFVLSAQYKAVLSADVQAAINNDPLRHIQVLAFNSAQVGHYFSNKGINIGNHVDRATQLSGGIPLYLHYISEYLIKTKKGTYEEKLEKFPALENGEISTYHEYLFQNLHSNTLAVKVLSVLAYSKEYIDASAICKILSHTQLPTTTEQIQQVLDDHSHLLRQKDGKSYSIFHNSFREFIISKTPNWEAVFNEALVKYYEAEPHSDQAYRNYFRHLFALGQYEKLTTACTLEWVKTAWKNYRAIEEIISNVLLALNTAAEAANLSEFIRLVFIKAQLARLQWNMERSEIDFHTLFLQAGLTQNSIRSIWDGDFVLTNKPYFAYYLGEYHLKTGTLLHAEVLQQGLDESPRKYEDVVRACQSKSLIVNDVASIFQDIDAITWVNSDADRRYYQKKDFSEDENARTNRKIKYRVIEYLEQHNQYQKLNALLLAVENKKVLARIRISLAMLLLPSDRATAIALIKEIDTSALPKRAAQKMISSFTTHLSDDEILLHFPKLKIKRPQLFKEVVETQIGRYHLRKEVIDLFDHLKAIWIYRPELIDRLVRNISRFSAPARNIYKSIFKLSHLWHTVRTSDLDSIAWREALEEVVSLLYVKRYEAPKLVNKSLFDYHGYDIFIRNDMHRLFKDIFSYAVEILEADDIEKIITHWLDLENGSDGYRHHRVGLEIAEAIYSRHKEELAGLTLKVIKHAEEIAHREQGTLTLADYLGEIAEAYGKCGFPAEFERIYSQLFEVSFGVGSRKDYQSTYIITALKGIQKIDPEGGLKRLQEVLVVQNQLKDAGNGRMHHIALSELIEFTSQHYPELAFDLILEEDSSLWRSEALYIILKPLITNAPPNELPLLYSIVQTVPHWVGRRGGQEDHFIELCDILFGRSLELEAEDFSRRLLEDIQYHVRVELEDDSELLPFYETIQKNGRDPVSFGLEPPASESKPIEKERLFQGDEFKESNGLPKVQKLIEIFNANPEEFHKRFQEAYEMAIRNRKNHTLRSEYNQLKTIFSEFYDSLAPSDQPGTVTLRKIIRLYLQLKKAIIEADPKERLHASDIGALLKTFVTDVDKLIGKNAFRKFVRKEFDIDAWLNSTAQSINGHQHLLVTNTLSEEGIFEFVEKVSIFKIDDLLSFVNQWLEGGTRYTALLKVAHRLKDLNPSKAKELLEEIADSNQGGILAPDHKKSGKLSTEIIESVFQTDPDFAKRFLLKNYLVRKAKDDDYLVGDIDELLEHGGYFDINEAYRTYYAANLQYNKELATGLPPSDKSYEFIVHHREKKGMAEITVSYLVRLFDYPVIKVREAALRSLYNLAHNQPEYLPVLLQGGFREYSDNQLEYTLILCRAIALSQPASLIPYKKQFWEATLREHFNILESAKELLLAIDLYYADNQPEPRKGNKCSGLLYSIKDYLKRLFKDDRYFLTKRESTKLRQLNKPTKSTQPQHIGKPEPCKVWFIPPFPRRILEKLQAFDESIWNDVYRKVTSKQEFSAYNLDEDAKVHRQYNSNSNFDTIEIHSHFHEVVMSCINRVFYQKIKAGNFTQSTVNQMSLDFRLHDPRSLIIKPQLKPDYINWLANDLLEDDFLEFKDIGKNWPSAFIDREDGFITLFERGSQRPPSEYRAEKNISHFEVTCFLKSKGFDNSELNADGGQTFIEHVNKYSHELPTDPVEAENRPVDQIIPLLEVTSNNFRGESGLKYANLTRKAFDELGIKVCSLLKVMLQGDDFQLKAIHWQKAYTSGSERRRYQPTSEGFTLRIKRDILKNYLNKNDLVLCYDLAVRRTVDKYRPETHMHWEGLKQRFEVDL